jgi:hypothetical protein
VGRESTVKSLRRPREEQLNWADQGEREEPLHGNRDSFCGAMVSMSHGGWHLCL